MTGKEKIMEIQEYDKKKNNEVTERIIALRLSKNLKSKDVAIQMGGNGRALLPSGGTGLSVEHKDALQSFPDIGSIRGYITDRE